jgi:hypothetical protein
MIVMVALQYNKYSRRVRLATSSKCEGAIALGMLEHYAKRQKLDPYDSKINHKDLEPRQTG